MEPKAGNGRALRCRRACGIRQEPRSLRGKGAVRARRLFLYLIRQSQRGIYCWCTEPLCGSNLRANSAAFRKGAKSSPNTRIEAEYLSSADMEQLPKVKQTPLFFLFFSFSFFWKHYMKSVCSVDQAAHPTAAANYRRLQQHSAHLLEPDYDGYLRQEHAAPCMHTRAQVMQP